MMMEEKKVNQFLQRAKDTVADNQRLQTLLVAVGDKLENISQKNELTKNLFQKVKTIVKMVKAHFSGEFSAFSTQTVLMLVFGLVYFLSPIDFIPDFIPGLGFSDDLSLLVFIYNSLSEDISEFEAWEASLAEE